MYPLLIAFFDGDENAETGVGAKREGESILVAIGGETHELTRAQATALQSAIGDAVTDTQEFLHTVGKHRDDGKYVVSRRCADSAGNTKVFDDFANLRRLVERLPTEFTAEEMGRTGITGSRRHMLVRHVGEHPAFDCEITSRNPLTVRKTSVDVDCRADGGSAADD